MSKRDVAVELFKKGYNCSQAVCCAFSEECGLDVETMAKIGLMLGGGVSRLREVCGAVTGMGVVLGLITGKGTPCSLEEKGAYYKEMQFVADKYKDIHGSIVCREILKLRTKGADSPIPQERNEEYYKTRPCAKCVGDAANIIEEYIISGQ